MRNIEFLKVFFAIVVIYMYFQFSRIFGGPGDASANFSTMLMPYRFLRVSANNQLMTSFDIIGELFRVSNLNIDDSEEAFHIPLLLYEYTCTGL